MNDEKKVLLLGIAMAGSFSYLALSVYFIILYLEYYFINTNNTELKFIYTIPIILGIIFIVFFLLTIVAIYYKIMEIQIRRGIIEKEQ